MASASSPLAGFDRLGRGVWLHTPSSTATPSAGHAPRLLVLCTWMGASTRHIAKYTAEYSALLPDTAILVVQSEAADVLYHSDASQERRMAGACRTICAALSTDDENSGNSSARAGIVVHFFSNGGAQSACQLLGQVRSRTGRQVPLAALLCDSSPGKPTVIAGFNAFKVGLPKRGVARWIGLALICVFMAFFLVSSFLLRREDMISRVRRVLNDPRQFDKTALRTYLYSQADEMVDWHHVEEHAMAARRDGYRVQTKRFEKSGHCAHANMYKDEYWRAVKDALDPSKVS